MNVLGVLAFESTLLILWMTTLGSVFHILVSLVMNC